MNSIHDQAKSIFLSAVEITVPEERRKFVEEECGGNEELRAEIDGLHQRVAELEVVEQRMHELENRIEFSERLLTQQRDSAPIERGRA